MCALFHLSSRFKSSSRSAKRCWCFFILKTEKKLSAAAQRCFVCVGVKPRRYKKLKENEKKSIKKRQRVFLSILLFRFQCDVSKACVITFMENTHFPFYLVFSVLRSLGASAWGIFLFIIRSQHFLRKK